MRELNSTFLDDLEVEVKNNAKLAEYTTFQLGGPCKGLITCKTPAHLEHIIKQFHTDKMEYILIGGGSNLIVSDEGLDCFVVRYCSDTAVIERDDNVLTVSGSTNLDTLCLFAVENELEGLNCCTGIPGTVGGAVVGNAGAFGKQVGDVINSVELLSREGSKKQVGPDFLRFEYRNSFLKSIDDIVTTVRFQLKPGKREDLMRERLEILELRAAKHPNIYKNPCAGSFFRNVEPTSSAGRRQAAGWFLEQAGAKNLSCGGAKTFSKHANIIIKGDNCSADDVYDLSLKMADLVKEKFAVELEREVRCVGKFKNMPLETKSIVW